MESLENPYDLFISYGRRDDDDFIKQLYEDLTKQGYNVWYDLESAESNGSSFLQNTRDALVDNPIRLILVVSPHALESEFVKTEWQFALENCIVIIPVLRMGFERDKKDKFTVSDKDFELVPEPLRKRRLHCIDFRRERSYKDALDDLLFSLSKDVKNLATLHGVINKPNNYIEREQEIESVKEFILKDAYQPTVITSVAKAAAIQGMGGIGKSVIAAAICHDCDVRRSFQDGIYWVTIGQHPDMQKALQYVTKDDTINLRDKYEEARDKLRAFLKDKNCLIVLDDVWKQEHIEIFPGDNALKCRLLITTRNKQTVKHLSKHTFEIGLLNNEDALLLLANATAKKLENLPNEAVEIVKECGNLPLAISMIGGMIKAGDENTWRHSFTMLQEADLEVISQKFPDYPYPDLFKAIDISINALNEGSRNRYLQLGIFKEDTRIPEDIIHILWRTESWKEYHTHQLINDFVERSILQRIDNGIYELHDLQFDYIKKTATNLQAIHLQLVNNLGDPFKLSHSYAWNNYIWHLKEAGKQEIATLLLQDFDWLEAKLFATNINELLKDYECFPLDDNNELIYRALKLSVHVLTEDKNQLPAQTIGRLGYFGNGPIKQLLKKATIWKKRVWLRPVKPSLTSPGNLLRILKGHTDSIKSLLVYENKIVSGSFDKAIRIWDTESGQCLRTLKGHTDSINSLVVYENKIISGSSDKTIRIWDMESDQCVRTLKGHTMVIRLLLTQNGKILSSDDNTIRIWDIDSGDCLQELRSQPKLFSSIVVCEDKIITSSHDSMIRIWDIASGQCRQTLKGHGSEIASLLVHAGKIFSGSSDKTIRIWDINSGQCLQTLQSHTGSHLLLVHEDKIISASFDTIQIFSIESGKCVQILKGHTGHIISLLVYEDKLISRANDRTVRIWEIASWRCIKTLQGHTRGIRSLFACDNKIITGSDDCTIRIWEIKSGQCIQILKWHTGEIDSLLVQDGKIFSGSRDSSIGVWEITSKYGLPAQPMHTNLISSLGVYDNKIFSGSHDKNIRIWEITSGRCLQTLEGHTGWILSLLTYDNKIISGSDDKTIRIWEMASGRCLQILKEHAGDIHLLCVQDGKIISGSYDKTIRIWELASGRCIQTLQGHRGWILSLLVQDGKIISGADNGTILIWELASGRCIQTLQGDIGQISSLLVYENKIISGSSDKTIRIWDINSGQCVKIFRENAGWIRSLLIYEDKIISCSDDSYFNETYKVTIKIWKMATGECLKTFEGHTGKIRSMLIQHNKLISADSSGLLIVSDINMFTPISKYYSDAQFTSQVIFDHDRIICGDQFGQLHILEMIEV